MLMRWQITCGVPSLPYAYSGQLARREGGGLPSTPQYRLRKWTTGSGGMSPLEFSWELSGSGWATCHIAFRS